jgi:hypothetical protein
MAGPSVTVKFLADMKALGDSVKQVGTAGQTVAKSMGDAFHGVLGALNQSGVLGPFGSALSGVDTALQTINQHGKQIGTTMMGVGGALAGVGVGLAALGSKDQAAHQQLQTAVEATGKDYEDYATRVESAIKSQERFGNSAKDTQDALRILTQATGDPQKALDLLNTATDLAAAKHESLDAAATQLSKTYNGATRLLKEFGVTTKDATGAAKDHDEVITELGIKLGGQASAQADTFNGHIKAMKAYVEDAAAAFGQKYGPAITIAGTAMAGLGGVMQVVTGIRTALTAATEAGTAATEAATAAEDAAAVSEGLALGPILLIIAAVAVLGVAIYELATHWSTVWGAMKDAVAFVWNWIRDNWPLLLAILMGPIGIAVDLIVQNWGRIKAGLQDAYNFIVDTWGKVIAFLAGVVTTIGRVFASVWDTARNASQAVHDFIVDRWNDLVGFLTGIPKRITTALGGMWSFLTEGFRGALNAIIDLWNRLQFKTPDLSIGPVHFGGQTIGLPNIPHLAQGGLMTSDGLVFAHAGEVISPAPAGARGPLVNIENVNMSDGADVDLLLSKLHFATIAGRL